MPASGEAAWARRRRRRRRRRRPRPRRSPRSPMMSCLVDARRRMFMLSPLQVCLTVVVPRSLDSRLRAGSTRVTRGPSISSLPPWRSAVARTSARPRPEPGLPRASSPRQNRVVAASTRSGGMPGAGVGTVSRTSSPAPLHRHVDRPVRGAVGDARFRSGCEARGRGPLRRRARGRGRSRRTATRSPATASASSSSRTGSVGQRRRRPRAPGAAARRRGGSAARRRSRRSSSASWSAPWRARYSAFPRRAASGFRSSWEASATNRRSPSRARSSAASIRFSVSARRGHLVGRAARRRLRRAGAARDRRGARSPRRRRPAPQRPQRPAGEDEGDRRHQQGRRQGRGDDQRARLGERRVDLVRWSTRRSPRRRMRGRPASASGATYMRACLPASVAVAVAAPAAPDRGVDAAAPPRAALRRTRPAASTTRPCRSTTSTSSRRDSRRTRSAPRATSAAPAPWRRAAATWAARSRSVWSSASCRWRESSTCTAAPSTTTATTIETAAAATTRVRSAGPRGCAAAAVIAAARSRPRGPCGSAEGRRACGAGRRRSGRRRSRSPRSRRSRRSSIAVRRESTLPGSLHEELEQRRLALGQLDRAAAADEHAARRCRA